MEIYNFYNSKTGARHVFNMHYVKRVTMYQFGQATDGEPLYAIDLIYGLNDVSTVKSKMKKEEAEDLLSEFVAALKSI